MAEYGNPLNAFASGWDTSQSIFDQSARKRAGNALAGGNAPGAASILFKGGLLEEGAQVQAGAQRQRREASEQDRAVAKEEWEFYRDAAMMLSRIAKERGPEELGRAYDTLAPILAKMPGSNPQSVAHLREQIIANPSILDAVVQTAEKELKGSWKELKNADGSSHFEFFPDDPRTPLPPAAPQTPGGVQTGRPQATTSAATPTPGAGAKFEDVWTAAKMQESGNRPGVLGPQTEYGQAQGLTQMLPATAQGMAQKLGLPWRPELMTGTSDEAANYQERLGRAYFEEGWEKYGGDPEKALMYYHGGPNENIWGPKTRAHADAVMRRVRPYEVASSGETPAPPSASPYRREGSAAQRPEWEQLSPEESKRYGVGNYQRNTKTGQVQQIAGSAPSSSAKPPTDGQRQTVAFAFRTVRANDRMNALADRGIFKPRTATAQLFDTDKNGVVRVITKTAEDRQFIQAAKEWLAPVLRKDTGAAVTDAELATYMDIFIPKYEDDYETLKQKANARFDTMTALLAQGGDLYDKTHGARRYEVKYPARSGGAKGGKPRGRQSLDQIFGD